MNLYILTKHFAQHDKKKTIVQVIVFNIPKLPPIASGRKVSHCPIGMRSSNRKAKLFKTYKKFLI